MHSPLIVTTWPFGVAACQTGWELLMRGSSAIDAIEKAANVTELDPNVSSVGYGGRPNAEGIVELDAAIMDGKSHAAGAVGGLTDIRTPISVARRVMEKTPHVMLVGANALKFASDEGFPFENLLTEESRKRWEAWSGLAQPAEVAHFPDAASRFTEGSNFSSNLSSNFSSNFSSDSSSEPHGRAPVGRPPHSPIATPENHDTIGLCAIDLNGNIAAGCTTSGMAWKVPGRVGDSPIIGSGLYVDNEVGAAAATGHGDEMMKACLSYRVVVNMERGATPTEACIEALRYLMRKRPPEIHENYGAAIIAVRKDGAYGGAATLTGFAPPHALWQWAVATPQIMASAHGAMEPAVQLNEGPYVTMDSVVDSLRNDR